MMQWYRVMTYIAGVPILIAVIILAYKIIISGFSIEKRNEAKDNILRLFFRSSCNRFCTIICKTYALFE